MHTLSSARRLVACLPLGLALVACAEAKNETASGFGSFSASNASQPSQASADPSATGEPTTGGTGDPGSTGDISGVTEEPGTASTNEDPGTTSGVDPSATTNPDPSTTNPDPSTTTGVDPSTTTGVDPSTTTGDPPDPPMKDPQPVNGLYETCVDNTPCTPPTNGCFTITDEMDKVIDGYCTILCNNVADCGPAPKAPAVQECLTISLAPMQKVCALKCVSVADCPTGMACTNLALPNNGMGSYCT